jgi:hypothetical protein
LPENRFHNDFERNLVLTKNDSVHLVKYSDSEGWLVTQTSNPTKVLQLQNDQVASGTSALTDTLLSMVLGPGAYDIDVTAFTSGSQAMKVAFAGTTIESSFRGQWSSLGNGAVLDSSDIASKTSQYSDPSLAGAASKYVFQGSSVVSTGGIFKLQFAPVSVDVADTSLKAGSRMKITPIRLI